MNRQSHFYMQSMVRYIVISMPVLQIILGGIYYLAKFRNALGGFLMSLEASLSLKDQSLLCMPFLRDHTK